MNYNFSKHYYDPFIRLKEEEWKDVVSRGFLSISEAATLSGYTRQYIHKLVQTGKIKSERCLNNLVITNKDFIKWYSSLPLVPHSPIGRSSYSLKGLMAYIGMSRSWILNFAERYQIQSYYLGLNRRFDETDCKTAWDIERIRYAQWLTIDEITTHLNIDAKELLTLVAKHMVKVRCIAYTDYYRKKDIEQEIRWRESHV